MLIDARTHETDLVEVARSRMPQTRAFDHASAAAAGGGAGRTGMPATTGAGTGTGTAGAPAAVGGRSGGGGMIAIPAAGSGGAGVGSMLPAFPDSGTCLLTTTDIEGPFYIDEAEVMNDDVSMFRSDVRDGHVGVEFRLYFRVMDARKSCGRPLHAHWMGRIKGQTTRLITTQLDCPADFTVDVHSTEPAYVARAAKIPAGSKNPPSGKPAMPAMQPTKGLVTGTLNVIVNG